MIAACRLQPAQPAGRCSAQRVALCACLIALLCACAGPGKQMADNGQQLIARGQVKEGLAELDRAMAAEPGNREIRMQWFRQREIALGQMLAQADAALAQGRTEDALALFAEAAALAPGNTRAANGVDFNHSSPKS